MLSEMDLISAKYYDAAEEAKAKATRPALIVRVIDLAVTVAVGAVAVCLIAFAALYYSGERVPMPAHPISWALWFGGANSDQIRETVLEDRTQAGQRQLDEMSQAVPSQGIR